MKNKSFNFILMFILISGTTIFGIRTLMVAGIRTGYEASSNAKAKVVREYFIGIENIAEIVVGVFNHE